MHASGQIKFSCKQCSKTLPDGERLPSLTESGHPALSALES